MTGEVRSRRGRAPGNEPYFDIPPRYARPDPPFADGPSAHPAFDDEAPPAQLVFPTHPPVRRIYQA
ncbi:hypothetical protein AB0945_28745, partial [Streptomyces sp. NPDC005474]|uniref:hypothetical protein n=1 Tax=Streptomyces sp. NPDC005474 TaxID=3154878 RepID=UPI003456F871